MPVDWEPRSRDFPRRNRLVSGLALGVVIVEAARGSGSLITARFAAEQNREVFAVPGSPLDRRAEGTNDLLRDGANLCARTEDVLNVLDPMRARDPFSILREGQSRFRRLCNGANPAAIDRDVAAPGSSCRRSCCARPLHASLSFSVRRRSPSTNWSVVAEAPIQDVRVILLELELAGKLEYSGGERVSLMASKAGD